MRGLFVGRFQPFHSGHLAAVERIRREHPDEALLLVVGTAEISHTRDNPFTAGERVEMSLRALTAAGVDRVLVVPLPDLNRHSLWVGYLESMLPPFERVYTNNPLTRELFEAARHPVASLPWEDRVHLEGRIIRRSLAEGGDWALRVPPSVALYLQQIGAPARLRAIIAAPEVPATAGH